MSTEHEYTIEHNDFLRGCQVNVDLYRDMSWAILIDKIPAEDLFTELYNNQSKFKGNMFQAISTLLHKHAGDRSISKDDCDVTLLYSIIRNLTSLPPPTRGWGFEPLLSTHISITDDFERMRLSRNKSYGHIKRASLNETDFNKLMEEAEDIVERVGQHLGVIGSENLFKEYLGDIKCKDISDHWEKKIKELRDIEIENRERIEENREKIEVHTERIEENKERIEEDREKIEENKERIEVHTERIEENKERIEENREKIEVQTEGIEENKERIEEDREKIEENKESIEENREKIEENREKIEVHTEGIEENKERIEEDREKIEENKERIEVHTERIEENTERIEEDREKIEENKERIEVHTEGIEENKERIEEDREKIEENKERIEVHTDRIEENKERIEENTERIKENKERIEDNKERIEQNKERIVEDRERIEENKERIEVHTERIEENKERIEVHTERIEENKERIEEDRERREEDRGRREEDRGRIEVLESAVAGCAEKTDKVQRRQEEERQKQHERATELSAGQDKLKNYLLKLYRDKILQKKTNVWFSMKDVLQMDVPLDIQEDLERWMALSRKDRKKERTSKAREGTKIKSKREMFFKGLERQFEIYLLGEAGVSKSTFCHQLIDNWCKVHDTEFNDDYLRELKSFPFLFFIQARHAKKSQSVYEMVQTQNCPLKFRSILEELFTSHPENCLILIDGLDEWQSGTRGYQELPNVTEIEGSTILITSRPWRIEALDCVLPSSCRVLEIQGLDSSGIENLAGKALEAFTREDHQFSDCKSLVKPFLDQIHALELDILAKIPFILLILIRSWLDGNRKLENARGFIYSGLIESLLIHSDKKVELSKTWGDRTKPNTLPTCFSERGNCLDNNLLLNDLARLAYDLLFSAEKENTLVIRKHDLAKLPRVEEHLQMCLKLGLLTKSKDVSETKECHRAFSFPHKTIQEFFCAVYLSGEEFEIGLAKFCERVTSTDEVFANENVVLFMSGMNPKRCKTLFDYICSIVFCRKFAHKRLHVYPYMFHQENRIEKLAEQCTAEASHSVPEGSHTGESQFVIPDMVVDIYTPEHKVEQFCRLGLNIKSLVYHGTVTPFSVVESIRTLQYIQRLGIGCTAENTEKYIACICTYLSDLHQLNSFSFCVEGYRRGIRPIHVSTELVRRLGTLPNLVSVYLNSINLSDINTCQFTSQLTSLGLENTMSLSPGVMSGWCNQLHTLYMWFVYLSPAAVHQLRQYLMTSSSLQSLTLYIPDMYNYPVTVFDDVLDLTSHTSLHTLKLYSIDLKSGVRIHPGHNWRKIFMQDVSMSKSMWQEFIHNLSTKPLQRLNVMLNYVKSLNTQTMSYIRDKFCVTDDSTNSNGRNIHFNTKH